MIWEIHTKLNFCFNLFPKCGHEQVSWLWYEKKNLVWTAIRKTFETFMIQRCRLVHEENLPHECSHHFLWDIIKIPWSTISLMLSTPSRRKFLVEIDDLSAFVLNSADESLCNANSLYIAKPMIKHLSRVAPVIIIRMWEIRWKIGLENLMGKSNKRED